MHLADQVLNNASQSQLTAFEGQSLPQTAQDNYERPKTFGKTQVSEQDQTDEFLA